jgi:hypothetical protein
LNPRLGLFGDYREARDVLVQPIRDDIGGIAWTGEEHHLLCNVSRLSGRKALIGSHESSPSRSSRSDENVREVE